MSKESTVLTTKRTDLQQVDPRNLVVEKDFNVRKDFGDIVALAHSVVEMGIIEPLVGFKVRNEDKFTITDGHRRLAAVLLAVQYNKEGKKGFEDISKISRVPLISGSSNAKERLYIMAITGGAKKSLTDLEKAEMFSRLIECGKLEGKKKTEVIAEIVSRAGVSQASVYNSLTLNALDPDIKAFVESGQISGGTVVTIIKEVKDVEKQKELVLEAIYNAEEKTKTNGKKVKATASNVKGLKQQSTIQRLKEVEAKLLEDKVNTMKSRILFELIDSLEKKLSVKKLLEIFI